MAKGRHVAKKKKPRKSSGGNKVRNVVLGLVLGICALIAVVAIGGFVAGRGDTIHPNITLSGTDLGGMTESQAEEALRAAGFTGDALEYVTVVMDGDFEFTVTASEIGLSQTPEAAAHAAYLYGHSGDPIADFFAYFKCILGMTDGVLAANSVDAEALKASVERGLSDFADFAAEVKVDEENAELTFLKGGESAVTDADALCDLVKDAFWNETERVEYKADISSADVPDFAGLHEDICREPKNAVYDAENHCLGQSEVGIDFDPDTARSIFDKAENGEWVVIPLTVTRPELSTEALGTALFADLLGEKMTTFKSSTQDRCTNVRLAAEKIDGTVLNPGETFSFNDVVGQRTAAAGFKPAGAYAGGQEVQQIGGGICQVSSTLYCSALLANLKITVRDCHYFAVSYVPYGLDATVSWGGPEFKFKNNRDYPIKIVAKCDTDSRTLTVQIWGTDVDGTYVEMTYAASTVYDTEYPDVAIGTEATTYRNVYAADGTLISKTKEAYSYYNYHKENIKWPEPEPEPEPTPTPSPSPSTEPTPEITPEPTPTPSDTTDEI